MQINWSNKRPEKYLGSKGRQQPVFSCQTADTGFDAAQWCDFCYAALDGLSSSCSPEERIEKEHNSPR